MKFKVGDKERVRRWEALEREFGVGIDGDIITVDGDIITVPYFFTKAMKKFCGKVLTINEVIEGNRYEDDHYNVEENGFAWIDEFFEGYAFEIGDEAEFSDNGKTWFKSIWVGYIDGAERPNLAVSQSSLEDYKKRKTYNFTAWRYARPIQEKKHKIIIDGKEIEISEEKYKALKESLLKEV